ncbi:hypothetical protein [Streptomyces sp. NPDC001652]|uniref:hypothetical protein n=1 Tax=Streptomyces sp. NPDC001652 TaxID=3154393 RepID=UPI00331FABBE
MFMYRATAGGAESRPDITGTASQGATAWTLAHAEAFRFFGGVPRRLVPDNLQTGVDKPDLY